MASDTTVALIGLGGVLVGGTVQYMATAISARWKYRIETRTGAYKAFIDSASRVSIFMGSVGGRLPAQMTDVERKTFVELQMQYEGARNQLTLYASPAVLKKVGTFTSKHAALKTDADCEAYIDFIEAMREDSYADNYPGYRKDVDNLMLRGMMRV